MNKNSEGFTLVELIATIVLLSLVVGIGMYSITRIIKKNKLENYNLLIANIRSAAETYYQECRYSKETISEMFNSVTDANNFCNDYSVTLGDLVKYGYLKGNKKITDGRDKDKYTIENPMNNILIKNCKIKVTNNNDNIIINSISTTNGCPLDSDYANGVSNYDGDSLNSSLSSKNETNTSSRQSTNSNSTSDGSNMVGRN